jgi:signal peptidase I
MTDDTLMNRPDRGRTGATSAIPAWAAPRRPWLALMLSLLATGTGQVYNGQWRKGAFFFLVETIIGLGLMLAMGTFCGLVAAGSVLILVSFVVAADAYRTARTGRYVPTRLNRWWVYVLIVALNVGVGLSMEGVFKDRCFQNYKIPSESMVPTLRVGDHLMAEQFGPDAVINRGDVVIFIEAQSGRHFVKRVIALPGETVRMNDKAVFVNGRRLDEPYAHHTSREMEPGRDSFPALSLGPRSYFLMGDNREQSYDSRWLGSVQREAIVGRALYLYFPGDAGEDGWFARLGERIR